MVVVVVEAVGEEVVGIDFEQAEGLMQKRETMKHDL